MKPVYNAQIIIETLNKHTKETFTQDKDEGSLFLSKNFSLFETGVYCFEVERMTDDRDTGGVNHWLIGNDLTLADAIDAINRELGEKDE